MRLLGLDIGERRIGVAVSDPSGRVATPLAVLDARVLARDGSSLRRLVEDYDAGGLVAGLPLTMAGEEGPQALTAREQALRLGESVGLPVAFWDERLSSAQAARSLREGGADARSMRGRLDAAAAAVMLQAYLDARASKVTETGNADV